MAVDRGTFPITNRTMNPVVKAILRSPLHRLLSGRLALITVTGRRSGREFTFPVGYQLDGDVVRIEAGWPERKLWWRNLEGDGGPARLVLAGAERTGHAVASGDPKSGVRVEVRLDPDPAAAGTAR